MPPFVSVARQAKATSLRASRASWRRAQGGAGERTPQEFKAQRHAPAERLVARHCQLEPIECSTESAHGAAQGGGLYRRVSTAMSSTQRPFKTCRLPG